ncbi:MAG: PEGA domain-containing protein [Alphaproteobacteria bacterium]|nr:PEGA domain-containing protein [Alphaproteobacteria bacterium]
MMLLLLNVLLLAGPALAQDTGKLEVKVANGTAGRVFVDGEDTGKNAPAVIDGLSSGNHMVQVKGDCLGAFTQVDVSPGRLTTIELTLEAQGGFAEISVTPAAAKVTINDDPLDVPAAIELPCGEHRLEARAPGYVTETRIVTVEMGGAYRYSLELLADGFGSLAVDVTPDGAKILVDGEKMATGDNTINQVRSGTHTVRAELNGYEPAETTVAVRPNEEVPVKLELKPSATEPDKPPPDPTPTPTPTPTARDPKRTAALALVAGGAGAVVGGTAIFLSTRDEFEYYNNKGNFSTNQERDDYYRDEVRGNAILSNTLNVAGAAMLAGGGLLLFIDDQGAVIGYTVRF